MYHHADVFIVGFPRPDPIKPSSPPSALSQVVLPPKGPESSNSEPIETFAPRISLAAIRLTSTRTTALLRASESISHF